MMVLSKPITRPSMSVIRTEAGHYTYEFTIVNSKYSRIKTWKDKKHATTSAKKFFDIFDVHADMIETGAMRKGKIMDHYRDLFTYEYTPDQYDDTGI